MKVWKLSKHVLAAGYCRQLHLDMPDAAEITLNNVAYPKKRIAVPNTPINAVRNQVVEDALEELNDVIYDDEIPGKLSAYVDKLSMRDVGVIVKLVRDVRLALGFFNWARQQKKFSELNLDVFLTMVHRLLVARKWEDLYRVVDNMHERNYYLDFRMFETVIKESSDAMRADVSEKWYEMMKQIGMKPNVFMYNLMIRVYGKHDRNEDAMKIFEEMKENKVKPTAVTFSLLISLVRDVAAAKGLYNQMKILGIKMDNRAYTTLLNAYTKAGDIDEAYGLFESLKKKKIRADVFMYNSLLEAYRKAEMMQRASSLMDEMLSNGCCPNEATYVIMLGVYCKAKLYDKSAELLKSVDHDKVKLGDEFYSNVIKAYAEEERWDDAISIFNEMQASSCRIKGSMYGLMVDVCFKAGHYDACEEFFEVVMSKGVCRNPDLYETMIKVYSKDESEECMKKMVKIYGCIQTAICPLTMEGYTLLRDSFIKNKNALLLKELDDDMKSGNVIKDYAT